MLHTTIMWLSRLALFPLAGLGPYDYGLMRYRYPMEFALQLPNSVLIIAVLHGWRGYQEGRQRELRASRLEAELERARLERLEAQLDPHFLFNTLNGISSLMYTDAARADRMLARLAELLRLNFARDGGSEVTLAQELAWLEAYLEIARLRFGERLTIRTAIAADALACRVPRLILQPLVENALEHGVEKRAGPAVVRIAAERHGDRLTLVVTDDGPGLQPAPGSTAWASPTRGRASRCCTAPRRPWASPSRRAAGSRSGLSCRPTRGPRRDRAPRGDRGRRTAGPRQAARLPCAPPGLRPRGRGG